MYSHEMVATPYKEVRSLKSNKKNFLRELAWRKEKHIENKGIIYCNAGILRLRGKRLIGVMFLLSIVKGEQCNIFYLVFLTLK